MKAFRGCALLGLCCAALFFCVACSDSSAGGDDYVVDVLGLSEMNGDQLEQAGFSHPDPMDWDESLRDSDMVKEYVRDYLFNEDHSVRLTLSEGDLAILQYDAEAAADPYTDFSDKTAIFNRFHLPEGNDTVAEDWYDSWWPVNEDKAQWIYTYKSGPIQSVFVLKVDPDAQTFGILSVVFRERG